jgi:hypothetical protein
MSHSKSLLLYKENEHFKSPLPAKKKTRIQKPLFLIRKKRSFQKALFLLRKNESFKKSSP